MHCLHLCVLYLYLEITLCLSKIVYVFGVGVGCWNSEMGRVHTTVPCYTESFSIV